MRRKKFHLFSVDRARSRPFGPATCFLCARRLSKKNRTDEDVFPIWLQKRFDLANQTITLLNGTALAYKKLKIPCCSECNNEHLSRIEHQVAKASLEGAAGLLALDPLVLHVWLGKIVYGILYRELFLKRDLRSKSRASILKRHHLLMFPMLHYSLQAARVRFSAVAAQPEIARVSTPLSSLFVVDVKKPTAKEAHFTFRDCQQPLCATILLGDVGIVGCFSDGGATRAQLDPLMTDLAGHRLHPIQFHELEAHVWYWASLFNRVPKYTIHEWENGVQGGVNVLGLPVQGLSSKPPFDARDPEAHVWMISQTTGASIEFLHPGPGLFRSFLLDGDDRVQEIDFDALPWGA